MPRTSGVTFLFGELMTRVVCLLPARNAEQDLLGFLDSARDFCDAIVALDDGSTDDTAHLLDSTPLVQILFRNPIRQDFRGWNDSVNRNRLLEAAAELNPDWIISVDADERIDRSDAVALRRFLETDALPGCAYRFQWLQMREDASHYFPEIIWIPRLFAFAHGQRFPENRLHFAPIPTSISQAAYVRTTLRIQHFGAMTDELRRARFEKYRQADPESAHWSDYSVILAESAKSLLPFHPRDPNLPVLLLETERQQISPTDHGRLLGTPISPASDGEAVTSIELLGIDTIEGFERSSVKGSDFVFSTEEGMGFSVEAQNAIMSAHRSGFAVVAPSIRSNAVTRLEKASYLLSFHPQLPGLGSASLTRLPLICSYAQPALREFAPTLNPTSSAIEKRLTINHALEAAGFICRREQNVEIALDVSGGQLRDLVANAFNVGKFATGHWIKEQRPRGRLLTPRNLWGRIIGQPRAKLRAIRAAAAQAEPHHTGWLDESYRYVKFGLTCEAFGSLVELFRPERGKLALLFGRATGFVLIVVNHGTQSGAVLLRFDAKEPNARGVWFGSDALHRLEDGESRPLSDLFAAREFAAKHCGAPVDGLIELSLLWKRPFHPSNFVVKRVLGERRLDEFRGSEFGEEPGLRTTIAARDFMLLAWTLFRMPSQSISIIDYPAGDNSRTQIAIHLGHGGDATSKWQAGPRPKRAM
ncbi:MAG: glycosyltransferase family 2 protein [Thermomicrobiales bacterium]